MFPSVERTRLTITEALTLLETESVRGLRHIVPAMQAIGNRYKFMYLFSLI
jgi:hypothetical protein